MPSSNQAMAISSFGTGPEPTTAPTVRTCEVMLVPAGTRLVRSPASMPARSVGSSTTAGMPTGSRTSASTTRLGLGVSVSVVAPTVGVVTVVVGAVSPDGEALRSSEPEQPAPARVRTTMRGKRRRTRACYRRPAA